MQNNNSHPLNSLQILTIRTVSGEEVEFVVFYTDNEIHVRQIYEKAEQVENSATKTTVCTPFGTRDFVFKLHSKDGHQTAIKQLSVAWDNGRAEALTILASDGIDSSLFRIPLNQFMLKLDANKKLTSLSFLAKTGQEMQQIMRHFDKHPMTQAIEPLTSSILIAYDGEQQALCLIDYSSPPGLQQVFKHGVQQFSAVSKPSNILVDTRGYSATTITPNKSSVLLVMNQLACVDCFEYHRQNKILELREETPQEPVQSKYSYLKQLYPLSLIPEGFKPESSQLIASSLGFTLGQTSHKDKKSNDQQFLFLVAMSWPADAPRPNEKPDVARYTTSSQLIQNVPEDVFLQNNVFLFNAKKLVAYVAVSFVPELVSISEDRKTIAVSSQKNKFCNTFRIVQRQDGTVQLTQVNCIDTTSQNDVSIALSKNWVVVQNASGGLKAVNDNQPETATVSARCATQFGVQVLPAKANKGSVIATSSSPRQRSSSTSGSKGQQKPLRVTQIPDIDGQAKKSFYSSRVEEEAKRMAQTLQPTIQRANHEAAEQKPKQTRFNSLVELAQSVGPITKKDEASLAEFNDMFVAYFDLHEKLHVIQDYALMIFKPEEDPASKKWLSKRTREWAKRVAAELYVQADQKRYRHKDAVFQYESLEYLSTLVHSTFDSYESDLSLNMEALNELSQLPPSGCIASTSYKQIRKMLEEQLLNVKSDPHVVCSALHQEFLKDPQIDFIELVARKTQALQDFFQLAVNMKLPVFRAVILEASKIVQKGQKTLPSIDVQQCTALFKNLFKIVDLGPSSLEEQPLLKPLEIKSKSPRSPVSPTLKLKPTLTKKPRPEREQDKTHTYTYEEFYEYSYDDFPDEKMDLQGVQADSSPPQASQEPRGLEGSSALNGTESQAPEVDIMSSAADETPVEENMLPPIVPDLGEEEHIVFRSPGPIPNPSQSQSLSRSASFGGRRTQEAPDALEVSDGPGAGKHAILQKVAPPALLKPKKQEQHNEGKAKEPTKIPGIQYSSPTTSAKLPKPVSPQRSPARFSGSGLSKAMSPSTIPYKPYSLGANVDVDALAKALGSKELAERVAAARASLALQTTQYGLFRHDITHLNQAPNTTLFAKIQNIVGDKFDHRVLIISDRNPKSYSTQE